MQQANILQIKLTIPSLRLQKMCISASSKAILWVTFNFFQTPSLSKLQYGGGEKAREVSLLYQHGHPLEGQCKSKKYNQMVLIA